MVGEASQASECEQGAVVARISGLERRDIGFAGLRRIDEVDLVPDEARPC